MAKPLPPWWKYQKTRIQSSKNSAFPCGVCACVRVWQRERERERCKLGKDDYLPCFDPHPIISVGQQSSIHHNILHLWPRVWFSQASDAKGYGSELVNVFMKSIVLTYSTYLMPWPGPQIMSLIRIREELPTIEMQSSPRVSLRSQYKIISNA